MVLIRRVLAAGLVLAVILAVVSCDASESGSAAREAAPAPESAVSDAAPAAVTAAPEPGPAAGASTRAATAQPAQPALTLLGHNDLGGPPGSIANVRGLGTYAYVGSRATGNRCPSEGVRVVDLADPANPRLVGYAAQYPGTTAEHPATLRVSTPAFTGDLLAVGIQRCTRPSAAPGGLAVWDITDPLNPAELSFFDTDPAPAGVHELDVTMQDGRVLALLAAPASELRGGVGDLRVVDITDPRRPVQLAHWGVRAALGITEGVGCSRGVYAHSVRASPDGRRAYVSYWDAGVIILDISTPSSPRVLGRVFDPESEGSAHSAEELPGGLLVVTEEVYAEQMRIGVEAAGVTEEMAACDTPSRNDLFSTGVLTGEIVDLGNVCARVPMSGSAAGRIALVSAGVFPLSSQAARAAAAGAVAVLVIGEGTAVRPVNEGNQPLGLPVIGVGREDGERLRALAQDGPVTVTMPSWRGWGAARVWDISDPASSVRRAVFRTPNADRFPPAAPGAFTVHNPLSHGRYALFSWYADGIRLLDLADPSSPHEVASFVPPQRPNVWGVDLLGELVLVSDMNSGLYVLRLEGAE